MIPADGLRGVHVQQENLQRVLGQGGHAIDGIGGYDSNMALAEHGHALKWRNLNSFHF